MACLQQRWPPEGPGKCKHPLLSILPACLPEAAADRVCLQATAVAATSDKVQPAAALPRELQQLVTTFSSVGAVYGCLALSNALEADLEVHGEVPTLEFGGFPKSHSDNFHVAAPWAISTRNAVAAGFNEQV